MFLISHWTFGMDERMPVADVFLNGHGPYRFVVDTGATSSVLRPRHAAAIGLKPDYRVEFVTASGQSLAPATRGVDVQSGGAQAANLELIWADYQGAENIDGVLGQNFLQRFDYLIQARAIHFGLHARQLAAVLRAAPIPFDLCDGRMLIPAASDTSPGLHLIVDSGASMPVLFQSHHNLATASVQTLNGATQASLATLPRLRLGRQWLYDVPAAYIPSTAGLRREDGLLPTALFRAIFVDNHRRQITLQR
jgi:predicted aspartyl protease